ncbi:hypothetical protein BGW80DRAFT_1251357 [Lactifluus volemus]|nr:hypothetical protein BGW80DRAFT_1251357 [Lactifluus volemus]
MDMQSIPEPMWQAEACKVARGRTSELRSSGWKPQKHSTLRVLANSRTEISWRVKKPRRRCNMLRQWYLGFSSSKRPRRTRQNVFIHGAGPGFPSSPAIRGPEIQDWPPPSDENGSPVKSGSVRFNDRVYSNFGYDSGDGRKRVARSGHGPGPRSTALRRSSIRRFRAGHDENKDENVGDGTGMILDPGKGTGA